MTVRFTSRTIAILVAPNALPDTGYAKVHLHDSKVT